MSASSQPRYTPPSLPDWFVLEVPDEDGAWVDWGRFAADAFALGNDGSLICAGHGGSPVILRCVHQRGPILHCLDGAGQPSIYRLVTLPDSRYGAAPAD